MPETLEATLDTNILLDFTRLGELQTLGHHPRVDVLVPEDVLVEVEEDDQRDAVEQAIQRDLLELVRIRSREVLETFAELANVVDDGEAACIAVAAHRDCYVATDERGATRDLIREYVGEGRQLDSVRVLLSLVREDVLDVSEADTILEGVSVEYGVDTLGRFLR